MRNLIPLAVVCGVFIVGCGESAEQRREEAARARAALQARRERREREHQQLVFSTCSRTFAALQDKLGALDSRLSVGMNFEAYGNAVASARVVYDRTDFGSIDLPEVDRLTCLGGVGVPLERALNQYVAAYGTWNDCIQEWGCDTDSIDGDLQARWSKATRAVVKSTSNLADLEPDDPASS